MNACKKEMNTTTRDIIYSMIENKTWFLDYTVTTKTTGINIKTYVGQSTYFINFLANRNTQDSDGLIGTYTVENINEQFQIHVQAKNNISSIEYIYNIESAGANNLVLYYTLNGQTVKQFFTNKK